MFNNHSKKLIMMLSWCWLLLPFTMLAHSTAQSSSLLVEDNNGNYTLQVRASLAAFEYVVHEEFTAQGYTNPQEFEALVLKLLSKQLALYINDKKVSLTNPRVKLGHESLVVYHVSVPADVENVAITNTLFKTIYKSKNLFIVLKNGIQKNLFTLDNTNQYSIALKIEKDQFVLVSAANSSKDFSKIGWYILAFILLVGAVARIIKPKPKKEITLKVIKD